MTPNKITESEIEQFAIELLEKRGYQYVYAPDIAPDSDTPERNRFEDVLLLERPRKAVGRIDPNISEDAREDAIKQIHCLNSPELIANNEAFHRMLTGGVKVSYHKDGADRGDLKKGVIKMVMTSASSDGPKISKNHTTKEPQEMGLSEFEYVFYTAIADNGSARELMQKEKLRELAVVLFEKVKQNASIDWTIKESVRAKLKVIVKRTLRQYGYPPDMQALAIETVLKQAELIADEIIKRG